MYVHELVQPLLQSLLVLSSSSTASNGSSGSSKCIGADGSSNTTVLIAHGRNRPAEADFKAAASQHFGIELISGPELDEMYQCSDVDVLRLKRL